MIAWLRRVLQQLAEALIYGAHARYGIFLDKDKK